MFPKMLLVQVLLEDVPLGFLVFLTHEERLPVFTDLLVNQLLVRFDLFLGKFEKLLALVL